MADYGARIAVCQTCEKYMKTFRVCGLCGCFLPVKARLDSQVCKLGKWDKSDFSGGFLKKPPEKKE